MGWIGIPTGPGSQVMAEIACEPPLDPEDKCRMVYDAVADRYFQKQLNDTNGILDPSTSDLEGLLRRNGGTFSGHSGKLLAGMSAAVMGTSGSLFVCAILAAQVP